MLRKTQKKIKEETKVIVKISKDKSKEFTNKWYMGSYVDSTIKQMDPLKDEHKVSKIDFIKSYLFQNLFGLTLFPVIVNKHTQLSQCLSQIVDLDKKYEECYYKYDDAQQLITLWDNINCILCKAYLKDYHYTLNRGPYYKFKGISVKLGKNNRYQYNTISFLYEFDFNGFSAKDYLTLNRKKFIESKSEEVVNIIDTKIIKINS